jgi:hypothetical protein
MGRIGPTGDGMVKKKRQSRVYHGVAARMRYSGASIGYQLASIIAGGPAPIVAAWLFSVYKTGTSIAIYICICALIGFIATLFMTEYSHQDISEEYEHVGKTR